MPVTFEELLPLLEIALDREAPEIEINTNLYTEAGMDSMGAVALVVEIERTFKVRLNEDLIPELHTPQQYLNAIQQASAQAAIAVEAHVSDRV
jgi:acyl carrier protein